MDDMKHDMICISCPMGCRLKIERFSESEIAVTGNRCMRGEQYAKEEILSPRRMVTATCRALAQKTPTAIKPLATGTLAANILANDLYRPCRIPLRTKKAFPKDRVSELLELIYALELRLPVDVGQVAIADALGTGIDVIVARSM